MNDMVGVGARPRSRWLPHLLAVLGGQVWKDVGSTGVGKVLGAVAAFAAGAVLARWLGPALRGTFELGLFIANSGVLLLCLGLNIPVAVFMLRDPARSMW